MTGTAPLNRRPAGIACVIGTPGLNSSDYIRVHAGQGERRGRSSVCWARPDNRAPLGSGLGGQRIATYDGFSTQVTRTLRARVSHTPG
ncbi:MAG: hypothetical protein JWM45_2732 [Pseudonocardiales bacterium]|nr:hypothetical protein [Pseudonocardiales bacterium]